MKAINNQALARQLLEVYRIFGMLEPANNEEPVTSKKAAASWVAAGNDVQTSELGTQIVRASRPPAKPDDVAREDG